MNEWLKKVRSQAEALWTSLTPRRRIYLIAGVAALFGTLLILSLTMGKPQYVPLFTNLEMNDAGEIVAKLKEGNIPYHLAENGSAILVPQENVYETRLSLASAGLPRGGVVGYELFNQSNLGTTDFERRLKFNVALQGELTRTIRQMAEVDDARIHIVQPERSLFIEEEKEPTASVFLKLKPYARLAEDQIRGIAHLVAGSVEGLKPENVTILDEKGDILSEFIIDEATDGPGTYSDRKLATQVQLKREREKELTKNVQTMLERVFGYGRVVARVNVDMNFDYQELNNETYTPSVGDTGILRSQQDSSEHYEGTGGSAPGGPPGVMSNVPGYQATDNTRTQSLYDKRQTVSNYEVNKSQEHRIPAPGRVDRVSVAVWVDGQLTPQQSESVRAAVASAVGYDQTRGDQITVESMNFAQPQAESTAAAATPAWVPWTVSGAALAVLAVAGVILMIRRRRQEQMEQEAMVAEVSVPVEVQPVEEPKMPLSPEEEAKQRVEKQIQRLASDKPQEFAQLLKTWLTEDER